MTTSSYTKIFKQIKGKPEKMKKFIKHCAPKKRACGLGNKKCERCGRFGGHISKYGLNFCRHCFREIAQDIGFKKYN